MTTNLSPATDSRYWTENTEYQVRSDVKINKDSFVFTIMFQIYFFAVTSDL